eukprot:1195787-Prorocentrum_minimum.AAC.2
MMRQKAVRWGIASRRPGVCGLCLRISKRAGGWFGRLGTKVRALRCAAKAPYLCCLVWRQGAEMLVCDERGHQEGVVLELQTLSTSHILSELHLSCGKPSSKNVQRSPQIELLRSALSI